MINGDQFLKVTAGLSLLMAGCGIFYHFVIFIPSEEKAKTQKNLQNQINYEMCLKDADAGYSYSWTVSYTHLRAHET